MTNGITGVMSLFTLRGVKFRRLAEYFLHLIWPVSCEICGRIGESLCENCRERIRKLEVPSRAITSLFDGNVIVRNAGNFTVYSAISYRTHIKKVIHAFKYNGRKELCRPIGRHIAEIFRTTEADYLIPVPLHMNSTRHYNQSQEIAKGMCDYWDIEMIDAAQWTKEIPRHALQAMKERREMPHDVFRITENIRGLKVALVDDVFTTGTTILRLCEACEKAGAFVVCGYTIASAGVYNSDG
ncbi:MAG: ComF family protein [Synergistaceae bacterium]|nr:ComF family protein [Synergistaceae bacterium]